MTWVKLDDQFFRKHLSGGLAGKALYLAGWCHSAANLTDGAISKAALPLLLAESEAPKRTVDRLLELGWWEDRGDHYFDSEFSETQRTRAEIEGVRDAAAVRMFDARSREQIENEPGTNGERSPTPVLSCPTGRTKRLLSFDDDFGLVWALYPLKKAKQDALKAYNARRNQGVDSDQLATAVKHYAEDCELNEREPRFTLHGATFFGPNERWRDYLEAPEIPSIEALMEPTRRVDKPAWVCSVGNPECVDGFVDTPAGAKACECR